MFDKIDLREDIQLQFSCGKQMGHEAENKEDSPGRSLTLSIASTETVDALATVADAGIDAAISSGALDGVPIFGIITGLTRAGRHIKDELFVRKTARFLQGLSTTSQDAKRRFVEDLQAKGKVEMFGETILLILERIDDAMKPLIIGRLMAAHVEGNLTYDEAIRLAAMVNRCYMPDLDYLIKFKPGPQREMQEIADALFSTGLLRNSGLDGGTIGDALSGGTIYEINRYGELLIKYGLLPSR